MTPLQALAYYEALSPEQRRGAFVEILSQATKDQYLEAVCTYEEATKECWWQDFDRRHSA